jgi:serine/threonine-protein kinase
VPPGRPVEEQDTVPAAPHRVPSGAVAAASGPGGTRALPRPDDDDPPAYVRARRRSRRVFAVWVAVVLVLALLVGVSAWWLGSGRWTAMPSLVGLERSAAERVLAEADLVARITETHHDDVEDGLVSATDPAAQARLLRGSTVQVTVSTGRPTVPEIEPGTPLAEAEQAVRDAGLTPVRSDDTDGSRSVPEGAVVRTDPEAGTELRSGDRVELVLSRGDDDEEDEDSDTVEVPFVIGEDYDDAADILDELGLDAEGRSAFLFGRENGRVVGQDPPAGATVERGTTVTLSTV